MGFNSGFKGLSTCSLYRLHKWDRETSLGRTLYNERNGKGFKIIVKPE